MSLLLLFQNNSNAGVNGLGSQTLDSISQTATASVSVAGLASQLLGSVSQTAIAAVLVSASASHTLDVATQTAAALVYVSAVAVETLDTVIQTANAAVTVSATASQTLADISQSASGTVSSSGISASASQTLADVSQTASGTVTGSGSGGGGTGCAILLTDGSFILETDGSSHLLLAQCVEVPETTPVSGGGGATTQRFRRKWWDSHKEPGRKKKKPEQVIGYAERVADAFSNATAKDAERLSERAVYLESLISQSDFAVSYLEDLAEQLREKALQAAQEEVVLLRNEHLRVASELAYRLEEELRDEEEATLLLLMV